MARLTREALFEAATAIGWERGTPLTADQKQQMRTRLRQKLTDADTAPTRVFDADGSIRPMRMDEAVENLLEELA